MVNDEAKILLDIITATHILKACIKLIKIDHFVRHYKMGERQKRHILDFEYKLQF